MMMVVVHPIVERWNEKNRKKKRTFSVHAIAHEMLKQLDEVAALENGLVCVLLLVPID